MNLSCLTSILAVFLAVTEPVLSFTPSNQERAPLYKSPRKIRSQYIITLKDATNIEAVSDKIRVAGGLLRQTGHVSHKLSKLVPTLVVELSADLLDMVRKLRPVKSVEENALVSQDSFTYQWGLDRIDQDSLPMNNDYSTAYSGKGVNVYVIDTDFVVDNPEFEGRASIHECSVGDGKDLYESGHGTHVAGIVGSKTFGVAPGVKLHFLQTTTISSVSVMLDCLVDTIVKPAVVVMGLGGFTPSYNNYVAEFIKETNVNFVTSAGNGRDDACFNPPCGAKEVITVAADSGSDWPYTRTNYGKCVDLFAPGQGIISIGVGSKKTDVRTGTSQACPHVAGALALLMEKEGRHIGYPEGEETLKTMAVEGRLKGDLKGSPNLLLQVPK